MTIPTRRKGPAVDPLNEFSRAIGTLEGIVTTLAETVTRQNESAEASREAVRQTIQTLGAGLTSLRRDVELLSDAVATMTPTVKRVAEAQLIGRGVVMGVGIVAALTGSGVAFILQKLFGALSP